ncbi:bifunctional (p)ppGpp synthetase/guanosine-3',5'-bis(diphosphate) 3'-pyrophosphohydrolase [Treponema ruminis]|uniref:GTP pyrophosphokinase n=1 Tax=Treponema ruminis TaxID=744515 RepID=A0A7W8G9T2_9SPIR|nr:RelA/SpoT family protein [Treponema ruminis]MBB5226492.1 GTP pyrophosphokinase [Treponema ruminis]QSI02604.1 bifunctional (p)ppGpp synthetase/guanosine-3',5'-bis(diphosphate) 3'-pyrophosphohydrolase [Treponema ruminis]
MGFDISTNKTETDPAVLIEQFFKTFGNFSEEEKNRFTFAWDFLCEKTNDIKRTCGLPYYLHPIRVAAILAQGQLDIDTVISGLLHSIFEVEGISHDEVKAKFGDTVYKIVKDTSKITGMKINATTIQQADSIRKMLFAMIDDVRVILVKLADRLDRMRNLKNIEEKKQRLVAAEVIDIWAPLADRLGMQSVKNELEDLSLKYSNPNVFQQIKAIVATKKDERATYLEKAVNAIYKSAEKVGINVSISSRAKHFYSIYKKMQKRNVPASSLYDLLALRVICDTNAECYTLIGIVHGLWKPMDGRFKDYIAMPKSNGYQSLHTTVVCEGKPLEIQIRTRDMHNMAEHGVASHWLYKKGMNHDKVDVNSLGIFNQLQNLKKENLSDETFFAELKGELLGDEIYVFTPKGDVVHLPQGSCAIDFAYHVHSGVGEKIVGAKADGKIIPITQALQNTQIIEIITNPQAHPTENQLKVVKTSKARQRIHSWLLANDPTFEDKAAAEQRARDLDAQNERSRAIQEEKRKHRSAKGENPELAERSKYTGKIIVEGTKNVEFNFAGCCNPQPGDPIVAYTNKKGLRIHKATCLTFQRIQNIEKRMVNVEWEKK